MKLIIRKWSFVFNVVLYLSFFISFTQCNSSAKRKPSPLSHARTGMDFLDVLKVVGIPDTIIHIGVVQDEFGSQTKTDEWWYGNNQVIVMVNDTVNAIDSDALATQQKIQRIIDSAKAVEGSNQPFIQPGQQ